MFVISGILQVEIKIKRRMETILFVHIIMEEISFQKKRKGYEIIFGAMRFTYKISGCMSFVRNLQFSQRMFFVLLTIP